MSQTVLKLDKISLRSKVSQYELKHFSNSHMKKQTLSTNVSSGPSVTSNYDLEDEK